MLNRRNLLGLAAAGIALAVAPTLTAQPNEIHLDTSVPVNLKVWQDQAQKMLDQGYGVHAVGCHFDTATNQITGGVLKFVRMR